MTCKVIAGHHGWPRRLVWMWFSAQYSDHLEKIYRTGRYNKLQIQKTDKIVVISVSLLHVPYHCPLT